MEIFDSAMQLRLLYRILSTIEDLFLKIKRRKQFPAFIFENSRSFSRRRTWQNVIES